MYELRVNKLHSKTLKTLNKKNNRYKNESPEKLSKGLEVVTKEKMEESHYESILDKDGIKIN